MSKKIRKPKKKPTQSLPESWLHAEGIIRTNGFNMALIDGTIFNCQQIVGLAELNEKHRLRYRRAGNNYEAVSEVLLHRPRTWTAVWAFIIDNGDDITVLSDYAHLQNFKMMDTGLATMNLAREEWNKARAENPESNYIGMFWMAIPTKSNNAEEMIEVFDDYLESKGAFDIDVCKESLGNNILDNVTKELLAIDGSTRLEDSKLTGKSVTELQSRYGKKPVEETVD